VVRQSAASEASARPRGGGKTEWVPPEGLALAIAGVGVVFAAHILYGALVSDVAMVMDCGAALILAAILGHPVLRRDLLGLKGLPIPALAFAATIGVAVWTLTPYVPGGPHPVWAYVGVREAAATIDKSSTIVEIVKLLGLACLFLVGAVTGASDARARTALNVTILAGALFGVWAFLGHVTGTVFHTQPRRLEAHFLNPNTAGTLFGVLLTLAVGVMFRRLRATPVRERLAAVLPLLAAVLVFTACLIATASRAALAATLAALAFFVLVQVLTGRWKPTRAVLGGLAAIAGLGLLVALAGDVLITRAFGTGQSAVARLFIWREHWAAYLASPLFGYGLGSFETVNKTLISASSFNELWNIRSALNVYLQWLEQAGLAGAAPMFLCIAAVLVATLAGAFRRSRMTVILFALLAADILVLVHGITDFALETPSFSAFWAWLLGLQFALAQGSSVR
jgi:O-antigen ligase